MVQLGKWGAPGGFRSGSAFLPLLLLLVCSGFLAPETRAGNEPLSSRVVIVVNGRDPDSLRIGEYYAARRGIPLENIIALDAPTEETISRQEFIDFIHNPLLRELIEREWILGLHSHLQDPEGRSRSVIEGHRIAYLVLCRGLPLRIRHDPARVTPRMERELREEFRTNRASVDSEVALLTSLPPIVGFVPNPLFENQSPGPAELNAVIKVARLDGATAADAMALVDHAIAGEHRGLRGRAYVDLTGPHATGDAWLRTTADQIRSLGYDLVVHEAKGVFPASARFDAPALYFGWYAEHLSGPFLLDEFRFPAGAIAFHIHSFSATTLKEASAGWVAPLVARGVTVTVGNVYEPYLELTHRPDLFLEWVKSGGNAGDAAAYAIRAFGWQGIFVGDPLYRPFARSLEEQLAQAGENAEDPLNGYAVIRRMNLLIAAGRKTEALEKGEAALARQRHLALAVTVAKLQLEARDRRRAIQALAGIQQLKPFAPIQAMLAKEAADLLSELNEHHLALEIYEALLQDARLPAEIRKFLLQDGVLLASRLGRRGLTQDWRAQLEKAEK
jgi:uncharacterized protein (TIGR03790 family)